MNKQYADYLLEKTKEDYNLIAKDYTRTRAFIPEDIKQLAEYILPGEKILDSGCASGRFFPLVKERKGDYVGIDLSEKLVEIARNYYPQAEFQTANALSLPFPDDSFDKVYSISVLHNIPSQNFQLRYLRETARVLKPKGLLILRVWDLWRRKEGWKLLFKYSLLKLIGMSKLNFYDVFMPWKNYQGKTVTMRYFHCFTEKGLERLIKRSGFKIKKIWRAGKDPRANLYVIAEKSL